MGKALIIIFVAVFALAAGIVSRISRFIVNSDPISHRLLIASAFLIIAAAILMLLTFIVPAFASTDYSTCEYLFNASGWDVFRCK